MRILFRFQLPQFARHFATNSQSSIYIFDRKAKRIQRDRAANDPNASTYAYLRTEFGHRMAERLFDIKRTFPVAIDLAAAGGVVAQHLDEQLVQNLILCDTARGFLIDAKRPNDNINIEFVQLDDASLPFKDSSADLIYSSLALHWVNDIPGTFKDVLRVLKNDGVFVGSMFGGDTLYELRSSMQLAELERLGGLSPHISPMIQAVDIANLLTGAGFNLVTVDSDELVVAYPSMFELMQDLQSMGESNVNVRSQRHLNRQVMTAAASIYKEMFGNEDGSVHATFQVFSFIGWKPDISQPKPMARGSANISFKDLHVVDSIVKERNKEE